MWEEDGRVGPFLNDQCFSLAFAWDNSQDQLLSGSGIDSMTHTPWRLAPFLLTRRLPQEGGWLGPGPLTHAGRLMFTWLLFIAQSLSLVLAIYGQGGHSTLLTGCSLYWEFNPLMLSVLCIRLWILFRAKNDVVFSGVYFVVHHTQSYTPLLP